MKVYKAIVVREADGEYSSGIEERNIDDLPDGDVLIRVQYSSLNYKDILVMQGARGLTKSYPHTPGIDAAGIVAESSSAAFSPEERVLVTGFDLGVNTPGGFSEYIRVPAGWVQKIPDSLTARDAMAYGTAGLTAGLSVHELQRNGITPESGPVAVTGASGGVGSIAVNILKRCGYSVTAVSNKTDDTRRLNALGAETVISSNELSSETRKHLLPPRWAGAVDTVGGTVLANIIKSTEYGGTVTNCGMVAGTEMNISVFPFLIRGVRLSGIDSVLCPSALREEIWNKIAGEWADPGISNAVTEVPLMELHTIIEQKGKGQLRGRVLIKII